MAVADTRQKTKGKFARGGFAFCLLPSLLIFLSFSLYQLHLPGFYYDEGFDLTPMLSVMHGEPVELLRGIGIAGYPVMRMDYMGSLNGYLNLPFMAALGPGVLAARLQPLVFSLITLVLAFVLARRWFGLGVATVTALLLSVNPSFLWFTRQGITVTSAMTVFSLGSWIVLDEVRKLEGWKVGRLAFVAGLCLGLGLWAKIVFLWWIALTVVLISVWLFTHKQRITHLLISLSPHLFTVLIGFALGAAPFIYYNLAGLAQGQPPATFNLLFRSLLNPTEYAVQNSNFLGNLDKRFQDFAVFLNGSYFWYLANVPYGNIFAVPTFLVSIVVGSLLAFSPLLGGEGSGVRWRKWLALLLCIALYLPMSSFTVSDLWATHFFVLLPLPQMVVACAAVWLAQAIGYWLLAKLRKPIANSQWPMVAFFVTLLLAPTFSRDIWVNQSYHAALTQGGGSGRFSDAVYKLADELDKHHIAEPIALDWGISQQLRVLTADRVRPREIFGFTPEPTDEFRAQVRDLLQDPSRQYLVLWGGDDKWKGFAVYNRRDEFTRIANEMGKQVTETFMAHERSGLPVYIILKAQ
jgi:hypothetical protein